MKHTTKTAIEIMTEEDNKTFEKFFRSIQGDCENLIGYPLSKGDVIYLTSFNKIAQMFSSTKMDLKERGYTILKGVPKDRGEESENLKCPKCGCNDYEEWDELEYEKGGEDPMYGGQLVPFKYSRCGNCDNGESELDQLESENKELREFLKVVYMSLCTYGKHPIIDNQYDKIKRKQLLEK